MIEYTRALSGVATSKKFRLKIIADESEFMERFQTEMEVSSNYPGNSY